MASETYRVGDEVFLVKDREAIIRYKGKLDGKKGTFYGVEVTVGTGKHNGEYHGKKYFDVKKKGQGMFVEKKHIIFKINDDDDYATYQPSNAKKLITSSTNLKPTNAKKKKKNKHAIAKSTGDVHAYTSATPMSDSISKRPKKKNAHKKATRSTDLGKNFAISRKRGPDKNDKPKGWKAPSWANDVLEKESRTSFLDDRQAHRGKLVDLKSLYDKAGYLPPAKLKKLKAQGYTDSDIQSMMALWDAEADGGGKKKKKKKGKGGKNKKKKKKHSGDSDDDSDDSWDSEEEERLRKAEAKRKKLLEEERMRLEEEERRRKEKHDEEQEQLKEERMLIQKQKKQQEEEMKRRRKELEDEKLKYEKKRKEREKELERERKKLQEELDRRNEEEERERQKLEEERKKLERERKDREKKKASDEKRLEKERRRLEKEKQRLAEEEEERKEEERIQRERREKIRKLKEEERRAKEKKLRGDNSDNSDGSGSDTGYTKKRKGKNPNNSDSDSSDDGSGRTKRRKGKNPKRKPPKKEYKIFFNVDIRCSKEDDLEDKISETKELRDPLAEIFDTKTKKDVFEIKTRVRTGGKAFKLEFGVKIATRMHPADYIEIFDELTNSGKIQAALETAFELDNGPDIHIWEARYEKLEDNKK